MRKRLINVIVIFIAVLIACSFITYRITANKDSTDKTFEHTIQEKLNNITNPEDIIVSVSSNPYDYIKGADSHEDYKYIVSQGKKSLDYMLNKFANSNKNGLEEYIMAIACSEILKENPSFKDWASGRGWFANYTKANK